MPEENNKNKSKYVTEVLSDECTRILLSDDNGRYTMTSYKVFPGITFVYSDAHIQSVRFEERSTTPDDIIEISHCREGRLESRINGECCYLSAGDIAVARTNSVSSSLYFPLRHYHGLTVYIDLNRAPYCLSCLLDDVAVQQKVISERLSNIGSGFIARVKPPFEHIFSELYSVPAVIQNGYLKIKALELLLFLSTLDTKQDELYERSYTRSQVKLAKAVCRYMTEHMDDRITLEQITEHFHISGAHIKKIFKGVYGVSIGAYIRTLKMESAAYMLEYTDKSILDIANEHGYNNGSKFASAFRSVKGINPTEYRNSCAKK